MGAGGNVMGSVVQSAADTHTLLIQLMHPEEPFPCLLAVRPLHTVQSGKFADQNYNMTF